MALFDNWPYTDLQKLNLDYVVTEAKNLKEYTERSEAAAELAEDKAEEADQKAQDATEARNDAQGYAGDAESYAEASRGYMSDASDAANDARYYAEHIGDPVSGIVADWLNDHLATPSTPPIDDTLTVQNAAADAKAAGDRCDGLETAVIELSCESEKIPDKWSQGTINTTDGSNYSSTTRCRYPEYIHFNNALPYIRITPASGYKFNLHKYADDLTYLGNTGFKSTAFDITDFNPAYYYRIVIGLTSDATLSPVNVAANAVSIEYHKTFKDTADPSLNLFYIPGKTKTVSGVTITNNDDGTVTFNGTASASIKVLIMGAQSESDNNVQPGIPYVYDKELISGTETNGTIWLGYRDADYPNTDETIYRNVKYVFASNPRVYLRISSGVAFSNATYKIIFAQSEYCEPYVRYNHFTAKDDISRYWIRKYKPREPGNIYFTIDVDRPAPFGSDTLTGSTESIECVLNLPTSYSSNGKPTRLVLCCHGSGGYVDSATDTWWSSDWMSFINALRNAGYATFDCNLYPPLNGDSSNSGEHFGSPLYVENCKKAYDYIVDNYNVYPEIFVHGCSMGGIAASLFSNLYPGIVLAESSFAGRDITLYFKRMLSTWTGSQKLAFANACGYNDFIDLQNDKLSHIQGYYPVLSLMEINNGQITIPPDRVSDFNSWCSYFAGLNSHTQNDTVNRFTGKRVVPYKAWNSWADDPSCTRLEQILEKAYNTGNTCIYYNVIYNIYTHSEMCYGAKENMNDQLVDWYQQFE